MIHDYCFLRFQTFLFNNRDILFIPPSVLFIPLPFHFEFVDKMTSRNTYHLKNKSEFTPPKILPPRRSASTANALPKPFALPKQVLKPIRNEFNLLS
jgi:hypothetical protein